MIVTTLVWQQIYNPCLTDLHHCLGLWLGHICVSKWYLFRYWLLSWSCIWKIQFLAAIFQINQSMSQKRTWSPRISNKFTSTTAATFLWLYFHLLTLKMWISRTPYAPSTEWTGCWVQLKAKCKFQWDCTVVQCHVYFSLHHGLICMINILLWTSLE